MPLWKFSVDTVPETERQAAWVDVLRRLKLPVADLSSLSRVRGSVMVTTTPLGCEFAVLESTPQTYSGRNPDHSSAVWLAVLARGEGILDHGGETTVLSPRSIIFGASGVDSTLRLTSDFRMLFIKIPQLAVSPRMITPLGQRVGILPGVSGLEKMFNGLLLNLADTLEALNDEHFQPVEQSMIEFLVACLASDGRIESKGGAAGARAFHLRRICQKIETLLHDPELSLLKVAAENGVSPRYVQKLFTGAQMTFSNYLKTRRLERCYADLISPVHAQLSVSEICFRWGFNDAAHFSRTFRERFGLSPSKHRQSGQPRI
ncbi:helix-turn-helix domain-containing protein [Asticcacaulis sp. BYS171W]|uniref:Helix-turn-helix domain-containing protein n=1 Tax=Asticcacaulis aquaticus TaxID=2984212 RepID=A0ABT5HY94_9CAUL|nr:helix-turn-helix domain-containing protein [Asticcacaulis aquaticus]MDC7685050.1 helix-turn-helix domain-containing protein [Asticcacaulis aquaticus]